MRYTGNRVGGSNPSPLRHNYDLRRNGLTAQSSASCYRIFLLLGATGSAGTPPRYASLQFGAHDPLSPLLLA